MYYLRILSLFATVFIFTISTQSQADVEDLFNKKGEVYFKFELAEQIDLDLLSHSISIDNLSQGKLVFAYANKKEFEQFLALQIPYKILKHPSELHIPLMNEKIYLDEINDWDFYPTYEAYVDIMYQFEATYPELCNVFSIGTSIEGRQLLFAKISDNVNDEEGEARVLYTSSIHGDETTGYILMLHLIDYLLSNYNSIDQVTNLVNNLEIWINPLANPDGTYAGGNTTVQGATRYNANNIDINRNFPDPEDGEHPDGNAWQKETIEFMELADSVSFVLSANFHGGAEVFNYPWDTWSQLHADDDWWQYVGREWADTVHANSLQGYFDDLDNGITNGYAWYSISGGRQDYMNYFHHCREVTLEISNTKLLPANQFPDFWERNYRSFLNYFEQALFGLQGMIIDSISGEPIAATVVIEGHDNNNSWVPTDPESGNYFRPLFQGVYDVTFSANGYHSKTINQVNIDNRGLTIEDVELVYSGSGVIDISASDKFQIGPNPSLGNIYLVYLGTQNIDCEIQVLNANGSVIQHFQQNFSAGSGNLILNLNVLSSGIYFVMITSDELNFREKVILQ